MEIIIKETTYRFIDELTSNMFIQFGFPPVELFENLNNKGDEMTIEKVGSLKPLFKYITELLELTSVDKIKFGDKGISLIWHIIRDPKFVPWILALYGDLNVKK